MSVVDRDDERRTLPGASEKSDCRHADREPLRRVAGLQAESSAQRVRVARVECRDHLAEGESHGRQPRERELGLRLGAAGLDDIHVGRAGERVAEERALADPGLAADQERATRAATRGREQRLDRPDLPLPPQEHGLMVGPFAAKNH